MRRRLFEDEHEEFRSSFRRFVDQEMLPHSDEWDRAGIVDRSAFSAAGRTGFLGMAVPAESGGGGSDDGGGDSGGEAAVWARFDDAAQEPT